MKLRSVGEIKDLKGKRIFLRAALDVPLNEVNGRLAIADDTRLRSNLPTIKFLVEVGAQIVLAGYVGRPEGQIDPARSTRIIADYYRKIFPRVRHLSFCAGPEAEKAAARLAAGEILVLENLRFLHAEMSNDEGLAQSYARLADYYINEAFSNCHRVEASLVAITKFLPSWAGFNLQEEVDHLSGVLVKPARPLLLIIGGAKVEIKLPVIKNFIGQADEILVGGLVGCQAAALSKLGPKVKYYCGDPDLSFNKAKEWALKVLAAKTIVWNGPLGDVDKNRILGTEMIAQAVVEASQSGAKSVVGGGDTQRYLRQNGFDKGITFISTGGGALLEFLSGKKLPALEALREV